MEAGHHSGEAPHEHRDCHPYATASAACAYSFAIELYDTQPIQDYLGHANVETTMIYTHVVKEFRTPARSPLDMLETRR